MINEDKRRLGNEWDIQQEKLYMIYKKETLIDFTIRSNDKPVSVYNFFNSLNYKEDVAFPNESTIQFAITNIKECKGKTAKDTTITTILKPLSFNDMEIDL